MGYHPHKTVDTLSPRHVSSSLQTICSLMAVKHRRIKLSNRKKVQERSPGSTTIPQLTTCQASKRGSLWQFRTREHTCGTHWIVTSIDLYCHFVSITSKQGNVRHRLETTTSYSKGLLLQFLKDY